MAITGFGVTELNLIGGSGTPIIESSNNLNLNAVTVAISTNATVGGTATFAGDVDIADTIYHTGDSNTKIRFPSNDTITFHTGGNEQFRIDSSGNIGVGTIAPIAKLDVRGGVNVTGISTFNDDVQFKGALYNALWDEATSKFKLYDLTQIAFGDGNDLQIYSDGTYGIIKGNDTTKITGITELGVSGISTFSGNVGLSTDLNVTGIATAASFKSSTTTGDGSDIAFATKYYITANGSSAYRFAGAGVLNSTDDPTLYFQRGSTYILENSTGGSHPFALRVSDGGSAYAPGGQFLTGSTTGTQVLTVPMDAPVSIVYQCTAHAGMVGIISFR